MRRLDSLLKLLKEEQRQRRKTLNCKSERAPFKPVKKTDNVLKVKVEKRAATEQCFRHNLGQWY